MNYFIEMQNSPLDRSVEGIFVTKDSLRNLDIVEYLYTHGYQDMSEYSRRLIMSPLLSKEQMLEYLETQDINHMFREVDELHSRQDTEEIRNFVAKYFHENLLNHVIDLDNVTPSRLLEVMGRGEYQCGSILGTTLVDFIAPTDKVEMAKDVWTGNNTYIFTIRDENNNYLEETAPAYFPSLEVHVILDYIQDRTGLNVEPNFIGHCKRLIGKYTVYNRQEKVTVTFVPDETQR